MTTPLNPDPRLWVDEYGDYLFRFAMLRLRDPEAAEDAVQETFLAALRAQDRFSGRSSPRTWLVGILKHKIVDHIRKRGREQPITDLEPEDGGGFDSLFDAKGHWNMSLAVGLPQEWKGNPRSLLQQREFAGVLQGCVDALPGRLGQAFVLRELDGLESEEICNRLNITATNLWAMLSRARARLRQCLEVKWFGKNG